MVDSCISKLDVSLWSLLPCPKDRSDKSERVKVWWSVPVNYLSFGVIEIVKNSLLDHCVKLYRNPRYMLLK